MSCSRFCSLSLSLSLPHVNSPSLFASFLPHTLCLRSAFMSLCLAVGKYIDGGGFVFWDGEPSEKNARRGDRRRGGRKHRRQLSMHKACGCAASVPAHVRTQHVRIHHVWFSHTYARKRLSMHLHTIKSTKTCITRLQGRWWQPQGECSRLHFNGECSRLQFSGDSVLAATAL